MWRMGGKPGAVQWRTYPSGSPGSSSTRSAAEVRRLAEHLRNFRAAGEARNNRIRRLELGLGTHLNAGTRHVIGTAAYPPLIARDRDGRPLGPARSQGHPAAVYQHPAAAGKRERRNHVVADTLAVEHIVDQNLARLIEVTAGLQMLIT